MKAVEYLVRDRLSTLGLDAIAELTHFACTSEDINSTSYALTVQRAVETRLAAEAARRHRGAQRARRRAPRRGDALAHARAAGDARRRWARRSRSSRGASSASPRRSRRGDYLAKFSGATGTWSAHLSADPDVDWPALSRSFIEGLGLGFNILTTQIESHDWQVELYDRVRHAGGILHNLATDIWTYISLGYFSQIPVAGATGSSTMPHKINPIRFENAEANLEISGGLLATLSQTLVTSRLQRDLTDSTTQRNIGVAFGHSLLALDNLQRGLREISLAEEVLLADLDANWEVLAEAIQTVVRAEIAAGRSQITDPYALLKDLTRGRRVGARRARRVRARARHRRCREGAPARRSRRRPTPAWLRSSSTSSDGLEPVRASASRPGCRGIRSSSSASPLVEQHRAIDRLRDLRGVDREQQQRDDHQHRDERDAGDDEGEHERRLVLLGRPGALEEAHRDERHDAGEQRGAEREPEQLHGLHQVAAGGAVVAHAGSFWSAGTGACASVVTGKALRGENPAIAR